MKEIKSKETNILLWGFMAVLFVIIFLVITLFFLKDVPDRGTFGDMFGSVNALFSGLAFAGIIFTILLQSKELKYQRYELQATREEFAVQNSTLKQQRFDSVFFNLLKQHNEIINHIDAGNGSKNLMGKTSFRSVFKLISNKMLVSKDINSDYHFIYEVYSSHFDQYFRNLYHILKVIHETEFVSIINVNYDIENGLDDRKYEDRNFELRYKYSAIIRAQLSRFELAFLFYHCLSDENIGSFKSLIEEYALLKNLPKDEITQRDLLIRYSASAYTNKSKVN